MERQQIVQFLEQTAALAAVMLLMLSLLKLLGLFHDENLYLLLLGLGTFMNVLGALRDHYKAYRVMMCLEICAAVICAGVMAYLVVR